MKVKEAIEIIRKKYYVSLEDISKAMMCNSANSLTKRLSRDSELKFSEILLLSKYFNMAIENFANNYDQPQYFPVDWYINKKVELYKDPDVKRYYLPIDYMKKYRPDFNVQDFKIISMIGHKMDGEVLYMRDKDTLLIDTSNTNLMVSGYFVYECENGNYIAMSGIEKLTQGKYKFYYSNPRFEDEYRNEEFLKEAKFKVVGRIIRNLSFFA